jgi:hypothetical protein
MQSTVLEVILDSPFRGRTQQRDEIIFQPTIATKL